ncbi:MAG: hypothetical protein HY744_03125 [Deltaproteobacteria bacterium]|nr:hypothetical protein [Deltaproteobacteria bacterium]
MHDANRGARSVGSPVSWPLGGCQRRLALLVAALGTLAAAGCGPKPFTLGPPALLPELHVPPPPAAPEARPPMLEAGGAEAGEIEIHKSREMPELRGKLLALAPLAEGPLGAQIEQVLTVRLIDRGVSRLIPASALVEVQGSVQRQEPGAAKGAIKGTVTLNAKLAALSLVAPASGADFVLYGHVRAGVEQRVVEVPLEIAAEDLAAYDAARKQYLAGTQRHLDVVQARCLSSRDRYDEEIRAFLKSGGRIGSDDPYGRAAAVAQEAYGRFGQACEEREAAIAERLKLAPSPKTLLDRAHKRKARLESAAKVLDAVVKLRDAATDETFWLASLHVRAPTAERAAELLAERLVAAMTAAQNAPDRAYDEDAPTPGR